jgi:hypothetical protein
VIAPYTRRCATDPCLQDTLLSDYLEAKPERKADSIWHCCTPGRLDWHCMLQVNEDEFLTRCRQPGGADWVCFLNNVLWAACWQMGISESAVRTVLLAKIPDTHSLKDCAGLFDELDPQYE